MNPLKTFSYHRGKLKDFYINAIAGVFSGVTIGIFFNLTTDVKFNRWINLVSYELFAAIIYVSFIIGVLLVFYFIGSLITKFLLKDKKRMLSFHLNFIAGTYSSIMSFLFVLYYKNPLIRNTIAIIGGIFFFVVAYFAIKKKW